MLAKKIRTIDTDQAAKAMNEYLQPIARSMCDAMRVTVELDDVINLVYPDIDKWNWNINRELLAAKVGVAFFPSPVKVDVSEWGCDDQTGYAIMIRGSLS